MVFPAPLVSPHELRRLIDELDRRSLPVPDEARHGYVLIDALEQSAEPPQFGSLLTMSADEITDLAFRATAHRVFAQELPNISGNFSTGIAVEMQQVLRQNLDPILDELRPTFDEAAQAVHDAVELGILPGMRAPEVILMPPKGVKAWQGLKDHMNKLEDIAHLRIRLVDTLDAAPRVGHWARDTRRPYEACFTSTGGSWFGSNPAETPWDRWLRLCRWEPAHLASVAETEDNASAIADPPPSAPIAPSTDSAELHNRNSSPNVSYGGESEGLDLSRSYA